jgi:hypothetical protein
MRLTISAWVCGFVLFASSSFAKTMTVATFNIKWYGLGGSMSGSFEDEYRESTLKSFFDRHLEGMDAILFQEIVDVEGLKRDVVSEDFNCYDYDHSDARHQSVVLCLKKPLRFVPHPDDEDLAIEDVAMGRHKSRPALHGLIVEGRRNLAYFIGVHLKAYPGETDQRLQQTQIIADYIDRAHRSYPIVVAGDFNSHISPMNGQDDDDKYLMATVFRDYETGIKLVDHELKTYRSRSYNYQLDQFYLSRSLRVVSDMDSFGPCNNEDQASTNGKEGQAYDLRWYNEHISDHCPLVISFRIP